MQKLVQGTWMNRVSLTFTLAPQKKKNVIIWFDIYNYILGLLQYTRIAYNPPSLSFDLLSTDYEERIEKGICCAKQPLSGD